jgi:hypothetical protein
METSSTIRSYMGVIIAREGPERGPRSQIMYRAVGQDGPGIQTSMTLPYNRLIVDEGSEEEPVVEAANVGDPCLIQFCKGEQRLIVWTEALVAGPCEGEGENTPEIPAGPGVPADPARPIEGQPVG